MSFDYTDWVETNLDKARPSAGSEWTATCPFCNKFGGFYVNVDPEHERCGSYVCFKCDARSRSFIGLIAQVEDVPFSAARRVLLKETVEFRRRETMDTLKDRIKAIRSPVDLDWDAAWGGGEVDGGLPPEYIPVWDGKTWRVPDYMTKRGFYRETLRDWKVGFCERGRYAGRVIIPFECPNGRSFTARDLTGSDVEDNGEFRPKYRNPSGVDHGRLLYGWHGVPLTSGFALVEGPLDAMKFQQHGIPALGCGGKVLRTEQLNMLFKKPADIPIVVMYDPEEELAPYGAAEQLIVRFTNISIGRLPKGIDPGASKLKVAHRAMESAVRFDGARAGRLRAMLKTARDRMYKRF